MTMKAIARRKFTPPNVNQTIDKWTRTAGKTLKSLKVGMKKVAWLAHREPGFCERHLLDENLGPDLRRTRW